MSDRLTKALDRILEGDTQLLESAGFARVTTTGAQTPSGIFEWEDRLEIRGDGTVRQTTYRSFADGPGQEPGVYELKKDRAYLLGILRTLREASVDALPPARVEPNDVGIRLSAVAGGAYIEWAVAAGDHLALRPVQPLLNQFVPLTLQLLDHPVMTLGLDCSAPAQAKVGSAPLTVGLRFRNSGSRGYWLVHPAKIVEDGRFEHCGLQYGIKPVVRDDIMPRPIQILRATLKPVANDSPDLIWITGHSETQINCTAQVDFPELGRYFMRAAFSTYAGGITASSQPRFVGGVFSQDVEVTVT
jgi:hypothetical protein